MEAFLKLSEPETSDNITPTTLERLRKSFLKSVEQHYVENIPSPVVKKMKPI